MTVTLQTDWRYTLTAAYVDDGDLNDQRGILAFLASDSLANGTAINQASKCWYKTNTLAATSVELDLAGGVTDAFNTALTFAKVKKLVIRNKRTTAGYILTVGPGTTNGISTIWGSTSDSEVVGPDGFMVKANPSDGFVITGGSADTLLIDAGSATVTYDIIVIGT